MRILLFDIDGVLVKPFGYRKAYFDTCQWLINQGKLPVNIPASDIPALFESYGVTSEWDMLAITGAILIYFVCKENSIQLLSTTLDAALHELKQITFAPMNIDFRKHINSISKAYQRNEIPSVGLLQSAEGFLPGLSKSLFVDILCQTRDAKQALLTRVFQNFVLGSEIFTNTYHIDSLFPCNSYLKEYDKPLLDSSMKNSLNRKKVKDELYFAALTARPSLGPRNYVGNKNIDYSPEAELALDVIQMPDMPLIGYGRLQYAEMINGFPADSLIKPDSFHTLAAIFSLITGSEQSGIDVASEMRKTNKLPSWIIDQVPNEMELSVYEDSQGGVRSVRTAAEQLRKLGISVRTHVYGVTSNEDKVNSLRQLDAMIFPDINTALKYDINF